MLHVWCGQLYNSVASEQSQHCGARRARSPKGWEVEFSGRAWGSAVSSSIVGSGAKPRPTGVLVHFGFFRWALMQSCYAKQCNQLINLAYYCKGGGEKILSPTHNFNIVGASAPLPPAVPTPFGIIIHKLSSVRLCSPQDVVSYCVPCKQHDVM